MQFSEQYLTYTEYQALGGTLEQMPFNLLEYEARNQVNLRTQNRLINQQIPQKVKLCVFHLIEKINSYSTASESASRNIASESTDGYSVSYVTASQIQDIVISKNKELQDTMLVDLYGVIINNEHIIYCG